MSVVRKVLRIAVAIFVLLLILLIAAIYFLQTNVAQFAQKYIKNHYGLTLKIGAAELRFDPLSIRVENLEVSSAPEKPSFFKAQNASAVIPFESLWGNEFVVTEASVDSPEINLNELPAFPKKSEQQTNQTRFRVESFRVTSGVVQIRDYKV